jgi:nicotinamidase-related amidase
MTTIDPEKTAILSMDFQNDIVKHFVQVDEALLERAREVQRVARAAGVPVIHVRIAFRPGYPEAPAWGPFAMVRDSGRMVEGSDGAAIHETVAPLAGDVVVTKKRIGAAAGSDLEQVLRALRRTHLVLMGVATSGVVLSTARWAVDADYTMHIVSDCCADRDPEVHRVLLEKVLVGMAPPITAAEFASAVA